MVHNDVVEDLRMTLEECAWGISWSDEEKFIAWAESQNNYFQLDGDQFLLTPFPPITIGSYKCHSVLPDHDPIPIRVYVKYPEKIEFVDEAAELYTYTESGVLQKMKPLFDGEEEFLRGMVANGKELGHTKITDPRQLRINITGMKQIIAAAKDRVVRQKGPLYNEYRR